MGHERDEVETRLTVGGMTCQNCARHVGEALRSVAGVSRAVVDLAHGTASVTWSSAASPNELLQALDDAGYSGTVADKPGAEEGKGSRFSGWRLNVALGLSVTIPLMILEWGLGVGLERWYHWLSFALVLPVQVLCGRRFYAGAWRQAKAGQSNMDTLVSLGSTAAFFYSVWGLAAQWNQHLYFMDAAAILTLVSAGHFLEEKVSAHAAYSLRELLGLTPETARQRVNGREEVVPAARLRPDDEVVLRAGDRVPTDGVAIEGSSTINESMLTGESLPVEKGPGSPLFAGTINESGQVVMRVTGTGEATALARIIQIVEQAQTSRANIQRLGDRVSSVFVPAVVLIALATGLGWGLAPAAANRWHDALTAILWQSHSPGGALAAAIHHAAAVLIIACPCAMGLATPIAIMAGTNVAARRGILIRDGIALEKSGRITTVIFDKTGTLTQGKVEVAAEEEFQPEGKSMAASLAGHSSHPLSKAIANLGKGEPARSFTAHFSEAREIRGSGLEAVREGLTFRLGSLPWLAENGVDISGAAGFTKQWTSEGASAVALSCEKKIAAIFALRDTLKPGAKEVVSELKNGGYSVYLLTGDNRQTAASIARQAGIAERNVYAEIRPEGKVKVIQDLQRQGRRVAFAGDGINDAPALQQADLGIALLNASDVARESADIVLLKADLEAIPEALRLAQRTLRTIKQNLFWAFFYNAAGIPLAALGFLSPIFSAFAMGMSDLIVVGNALRLRLGPRRHGK